MCSTVDMMKPLETAYAQFDARLCSVEYFLNDTDVFVVSKIHELFYQQSSAFPSSEAHYGTDVTTPQNGPIDSPIYWASQLPV